MPYDGSSKLSSKSASSARTSFIQLRPQDVQKLLNLNASRASSPGPDERPKKTRGFSAFSAQATANVSDAAGSIFSVKTDEHIYKQQHVPYKDPFQKHPLDPWSSQILSVLDATFSCVTWNVRCPPSVAGAITFPRSATAQIPAAVLLDPITSAGSSQIRIISKDFPWTIDLGPKSHPITGSELLWAMYDFLHQPLDDAVWGCTGDGQREIVEKAWKKREDPVLRNIDWLGKNVVFKGFYRDWDFAKKRLLPSMQEIPETWVVILGRS